MGNIASLKHCIVKKSEHRPPLETGLNILNKSRPAYRVLVLHLLRHLNKALVRDEMQTLRKASFCVVKIEEKKLF